MPAITEALNPAADAPEDADLADTIIREVRLYGDDARLLIMQRIAVVRIQAQTAGMTEAYGDLNDIIDRHLSRSAVAS